MYIHVLYVRTVVIAELPPAPSISCSLSLAPQATLSHSASLTSLRIIANDTALLLHLLPRMKLET